MKNPRSDASAITVMGNVYDLFLLRTVAILGQILIIGLIQTQVGIELPLKALSVIILVHAGWNLMTWWRLKRPAPLSQAEFFVQLLVDVLILTALFYFTGGATNPFTWIYLLPLMIVTINLHKRYAWGITLIAILCYSLLMAWYVPLPGTHMHHDSGFSQHIIGMWMGFVFSAVLMVHFLSHMAHNLRKRDRALANAREKALRDERLIALGTLAAGAAHELGTPLGTMAIVNNELLDDYPAEKDPVLHQQLLILDSQLKRCKDALSVISASSGASQATAGRLQEVATFLNELAAQWKQRRPDASVALDFPLEGGQQLILADETLRQALFGILDNAADASPKAVTLQARWYERALNLRVLDRGEGLRQTTPDRIGQPQVSTKDNGLGLGLFLAHGAVQRLGGDVQLFDREGGGVCTEVTLPLTAGAEE